MRKIRKAKWYNTYLPWLQKGELQADSLGDLKTENNSLSIWRIEDDKSNLDQVLTAMATTCAVASNLDYAIFTEQTISSLNLKIINSEGNSHDSKANAIWHRDLIELSAGSLLELAKVIFENAEKMRLQKRQVVDLIGRAVQIGQVPQARLSEEIRSAIKSLNRS